MSDKVLDFIEDYRVFIIIGIVVIILGAVFLGVRSSNLKKKEAEEARIAAEQAEAERLAALEQDVEEVQQPYNEYKNQLGLDAQRDHDERIDVKEPEKPTPPPVIEEKRAKYQPKVVVFDNQPVPEKAVNGDSFKDYFNAVSLADFDTYWGSDLTQEDFDGGSRYLVGWNQNPDDFTRGDLWSVGQLIDEFDTLKDNDCVKFTHLHTIGNMSSSHVALLCSYEWYSAFGLEKVLVLFEDISGTLKVTDFNAGDIFSATVFKHNMKVVEVNGQSVVCVEYNIFE